MAMERGQPTGTPSAFLAMSAMISAFRNGATMDSRSGMSVAEERPWCGLGQLWGELDVVHGPHVMCLPDIWVDIWLAPLADHDHGQIEQIIRPYGSGLDVQPTQRR
ncbi:hypothetical protein Aple_021850 [Acrocarpospora pleiomorpha]|uniref:Uncharacterized protein n=1 Tax=Acrocarpospora pleiomorpha TaxID=90975 RepID=A0A5M3XGM5_9ACTN|nr:hypothetical protein Aple_021850 [Acrocarpospora pleiomorpha]